MRRIGHWVLLACVGLALCAAVAGKAVAVDAAGKPGSPPDAGDANWRIEGIRVGFAGTYKVGTWTPVDVTLGGTGRRAAGRLRLTVPDGDGVPSTVAEPVEPGQSSVRCLVRFGRLASRLRVELLDAERVVARRTFRAGSIARGGPPPAVSALRRLIVCVGAEPLGVEEAVELAGGEPERRPAVARVEDLRELPLRWYGYEGVDVLVVSTTEPELFAGDRLGSARLDALDRWIRHGGRLVLLAASQGESLLGQGGPLSRFAPGRVEGAVRLRQAGAWEAFAESPDPMPAGLPGAGRLEWVVPELAGVGGVVEVRQGPLPLVVRTARGLGQVLFVAADLDRPPFAHWTGRPALVQKLLDLKVASTDGPAQGSAVMHFGYRNIGGQLRSALDGFSGVRLLPFSLVAGLMVVYVLLIGVGDYFFLRRVVGRMRWTWLTFPLLVAGVSVAAWLLAGALKGDRIRMNQVDLVDVDAASGSVRGTSWMNLFSPRVQQYDLAVRPRLPGGGEPEQADVLLAWFGLPGEALGGMDPQTTGFGEANTGYRFASQLAALDGFPIEQWSTRSLTARWTATAEAPIESGLVAEGRVPVGTIVHRLGFPLEGCLLAYRQWVFELGTVEPRRPVRIHSMLKRSELKTLLTGRRIVREGKDYRQESTPYDLASQDLAYILRTMMFFDAAGGRGYTGLTNNYQGFVDFSALLRTNRAILIGRVPQDAEHRPTTLLRGGEPMSGAMDQQLTVYRFVLPVSEPAVE